MDVKRNTEKKRREKPVNLDYPKHIKLDESTPPLCLSGGINVEERNGRERESIDRLLETQAGNSSNVNGATQREGDQ